MHSPFPWSRLNGALAATCGGQERCSQQEKRHGSGDPVAVAGLGERRRRCRSRLGLGRLVDRGLGYCRCCLGFRGRWFQLRICRGTCGGLSGSGISIGGRLVRAIARYLAPVGLPRRRRGDIGLNHHVRCHSACSIHHATSTKSPTNRRHKPCGHKRPTRTRNAAVGSVRIQPRGFDGKPTAGHTIAKARILQILLMFTKKWSE